MKIALIGASGFVGSAVLGEALQRGHAVTAIVRHPEKLEPHPQLSARKGDAYDADDIARAVAGHDAVVHAFNPGWGEPNIRELFLQGTRAIFAGVKQAGVARLLMVGGAGSLFVAPGLQLIDTPQFPAEYKEGAEGARQALELIRAEDSLDWSFISPPALLEPGSRTGRFRIGGDLLLMSGDHPANISVADLAVAIVDELEQPQHIRQRFTVGYQGAMQ
ncbi:NAD(P)H-binding protein [compost metagenome]